MNTRMKKTLALAACALLASPVMAQEAGSWSLRLGGSKIMPQVHSGDLGAPGLAGTKIDVKDASQVGGGITTMLTDHVAIDLPLSLPFQHDVVGDGAIGGVGRIGRVKALPITLMVQYRFLEPKAAFRPYVGAGLTYAKFYKARTTAVLSAISGGTPSNPTTMNVDSKLGYTAQVGVIVRLNDRWSLDGTVLKTLLKTAGHLSTGQSIDFRIDPLTVCVGVGYTF
jgi:outer membrane protein